MTPESAAFYAALVKRAAEKRKKAKEQADAWWYRMIWTRRERFRRKPKKWGMS